MPNDDQLKFNNIAHKKQSKTKVVLYRVPCTLYLFILIKCTEMKFSFASTALCLMSLMPSIHSQQDDGFCQDRNGNIKGPSGLQLIADDEERIRLDRRGGELCGCSYVSQSSDLTVRHGSFYSRCILNSSNIPK